MGVFDRKDKNENVIGGNKRKSTNTKRRSSACFGGPTDDQASTAVELLEESHHSIQEAPKVSLELSNDVTTNIESEVECEKNDIGEIVEMKGEDVEMKANDGELTKNDDTEDPVDDKFVKLLKSANKVDPRIELQDVKNVFPEETPCNVICVGCDEAGRGPLIGPVVCSAAIWLPFAETSELPLCDSKMLTKEEIREMVFDKMMLTPGLVWAAVEVSSNTIDIINVLNASLLGMSLACSAVLKILHSFIPSPSDPSSPGSVVPNVMLPLHEGVEIESGISEGTDQLFNQLFNPNGHSDSLRRHFKSRAFKNLPVVMFCDGDKVPRGASEGNAIEFKMTEEAGGHAPERGWLLNQWKHRGVELKAKSVVKGDSTHQSIATASIIAKVLRDRKMNIIAPLCIQPNMNWGRFVPDDDDEGLSVIDNLYICYDQLNEFTDDPYKVKDNKGYPTKNQKEFVQLYGASRYHRLSFNPTVDLLKKGNLRMPVELKDRAITLLSELKRRQAFKEGLKREKKRLRKDDENEEPQRKNKLHKGQKTLTSMFKGM